jgi:hypothetical protein
MNLWTKVHGLSETRWHRFPKPVAPVFVGSRGYTRDLPGYSYLFTPFTPIHLPRLRTVKGEREKAISWRFEDSTKDFKAWDKISVLPPHSKAAATLSPCQEVPHVLVLPDLLFQGLSLGILW